ncbi:hypothetical protein GSD1FS_1955 [Bifidobacterium sp. GSD1FS]|uniref:Uncharacterized protein n=1 Tax=Bifidobacterium canis TaxID=2610880 RepID=A0A7K1J7E3_9BIFI|nr:hypothetical protein [Bifidobacterium canis]
MLAMSDDDIEDHSETDCSSSVLNDVIASTVDNNANTSAAAMPMPSETPKAERCAGVIFTLGACCCAGCIGGTGC